MKRIDNSMITSLFNIAQFLNKFNTSPIIKPDVKIDLQAPLNLYHQRKDACRTIIVDNTSEEAITQPTELVFAQTKLKKIKVSAILNQPDVITELGLLNTFLEDMIQKHTTPDTPDIVLDTNNEGTENDNDNDEQ